MSCLTIGITGTVKREMSVPTAKRKTSAKLKVTSKGQVTLRKDLLRHLGVQPGDEILVDQLPEGRIQVKAARRKRDISEFFGSLKQENGPRLTIEEMNEIIAKGWAGEL
jgi:bifunctional DNA-binding transcriptional regulator/antitoxin component of YhaV-PrlF toxin-antitoxin module